MACKNEQCRCRNWCEVKSDDANDPNKCVQAMAIASWWRAKTSGLRDKEDFDKEDFEED